MGIIDSLRGGSQIPNLEPRTAIPRMSLTEDGKYKLSQLEVGDIRYRIMDAIAQKGMANIDEVKATTNLDKVVLRHHIIELEAQGYVLIRKTIH